MKNIKIAVILSALAILLTGCGEMLTDTMSKMEEQHKEFTKKMEEEGYSIKIEYAKDEYEKLYSRGNDEYIYESVTADSYSVMVCNVDGEYNGKYDNIDFSELGFDQDAIIDYCNESIDIFETRYEFITEGLYDDSYKIDYEETKNSFKAVGEYEDTDNPEVPSGRYQFVLDKNNKTIAYTDELYIITITIGEIEY